MAESAHERIVRNITVLHRKYTVIHPNFFKAKHYKTVLENLRSVRVESKEDVPRVAPGASIRNTIERILLSGEDHPDVTELEATAELQESMEAVAQVHGIGPAKARELVEKHGVRGVADLRESGREALLNEVQKKGLRYHDDIRKRVPRKEMIKHEEFLRQGGDVPLTVMGSYRRGRKSSGDIDVLLGGNTNPLRTFIARLVEQGYLKQGEEFAFGEVKYMGVCRLPRHKSWRRLDVLYAPPDEHPFAMLYFTGSKELNTRMRAHALSQGLTLNEKGLFRKEQRVAHPFRTERDIFEYLELPYVPPEER